MQEGWDATGLLQPLWQRVGGRDRLAELTGIGGGTLSGYNTGRLRLGIRNAEKIAVALNVTLEDLGHQPSSEPNWLTPLQQQLEAEVARLHRLNDALEAELAPAQPTRRRPAR